MSYSGYIKRLKPKGTLTPMLIPHSEWIALVENDPELVWREDLKGKDFENWNPSKPKTKAIYFPKPDNQSDWFTFDYNWKQGTFHFSAKGWDPRDSITDKILEVADKLKAKVIDEYGNDLDIDW